MPDKEQSEDQRSQDQIAKDYLDNLDARYDYSPDAIEDYQNGMGQKPISDEQVIRDHMRDLGKGEQLELPPDTPDELRKLIKNYPQQDVAQWVINAAKGSLEMLELYFERENRFRELDGLLSLPVRKAVQERLDVVNAIIDRKERERDNS